MQKLVARTSSDRTWGNGFKLKEARVGLYIRKKLLTVRIVMHLGQVAQRSSGCPIPGSVLRPGWMGLLPTAGVLEQDGH